MKRLSLLCVGLAMTTACGSTTNVYQASPTTTDGATDGATSEPEIATTGSPDSPVSTPDGGAPAETPSGVAGLTVSCKVPYILDAARVTDQIYLASHFSQLVQEYCITGVVRGVDITAFPEKMYYGTHAKGKLGLDQTAMQKTTLTPTYSVKMEFVPDSAAKTASVWALGVTGDEDTARVAVYKYTSATQACLFAIGTGGKLTFGSATGTTAEGGSFSVSGTVSLSEPKDVPTVCDDAAATSAPCCI